MKNKLHLIFLSLQDIDNNNVFCRQFICLVRKQKCISSKNSFVKSFEPFVKGIKNGLFIIEIPNLIKKNEALMKNYNKC